MGDSTLVEIIGKCCARELSTKQITQQIHAAAELFRKSYPEIKIAKEKIEAKGDISDPEVMAHVLNQEAEKIILKNFVARFKKKKTCC